MLARIHLPEGTHCVPSSSVFYLTGERDKDGLPIVSVTPGITPEVINQKRSIAGLLEYCEQTAREFDLAAAKAEAESGTNDTNERQQANKWKAWSHALRMQWLDDLERQTDAVRTAFATLESDLQGILARHSKRLSDANDCAYSKMMKQVATLADTTHALNSHVEQFNAATARWNKATYDLAISAANPKKKPRGAPAKKKTTAPKKRRR